jgi:hemerythrin-like domain-containing protein
MASTKSGKKSAASRSRTSGGSKRSTNSRKAPAQQDAIALLKQDHEKVRGLLKQLESASQRNTAKAGQLVQQIEQELKVHTTVEEEIFYPAFRDAARKKDDKQLYFESLEEHHVVDLVMPELRQGSSQPEEFAAKAKVLKELVEHHADEEEKEMFPKARKAMDRDELRELGERIQARKGELR